MQDTSTSWRVSPLRYRDPMGAVDWLRAAFGFELRFIARRIDGSFAYADIQLGAHQINVTARDERSLAPASAATSPTTIAVPDLAEHFARVKAGGAEIVHGLEPGGRSYVCRDIEGHLWSFHGERVSRLAAAAAWIGARGPHLRRIGSQRAAIAAAAALTLVAVSAWHFYSGSAASPSPGIAARQALEHARFALAEEQAARLVAEGARQSALAALARERTARQDAEQAARDMETELASARATRDAAEARILELDDTMSWSAQVASTGSPSPPKADLVPVSVSVAPLVPSPTPASPALADGVAALARGDVVEARHSFRRLAEAGLAEAALAMGSTYDPVNVGSPGLAESDLDREQAKHWYRRAIELAQAAAQPEPAP